MIMNMNTFIAMEEKRLISDIVFILCLSERHVCNCAIYSISSPLLIALHFYDQEVPVKC